MRYIVYLLIVANMAYLGWNLSRNQANDASWSSLPPIPATPAGVNKLVTLQEYTRDQSSSVDASGLDVLTESQPPGAVSSQACQALGPFLARTEVEAIAGRLSDLGLEPEHRSVESRVDNGFWVYLPAMERERSREIVQQLKAHKDKDYYVGKDWFISLGTFKIIERAEIRHAEVQKMGLDAILERRYKTREEYWLKLPNSAATSEALGVIAAENPDVQLHALSCL